MIPTRPRILLAGNWAWDIYEEALARGFEGQGCEVVPFRTGAVSGTPGDQSLLGRLRPSWALGSVNKALLDVAVDSRPDLIFLWRCIDILPSTLRSLRLRLPDAKFVAYHNDNPFKSVKQRLKCRHFLAGLKETDIAAVYRPDNLKAALAVGAKRAEIFPPSFIRALHRPVSSREVSDVVYVGHFEPDGRLEALNALHEAGVPVKVRGTGWQSAQAAHSWLARQPIEQLWGEAYVGALAGAKISLAFLSGKHGDVYTRRCFEIPACGSLLLAPRTAELRQFFQEDEEAVFWGSRDELVEKVRYLLSNEDRRAEIAAAGRRRVLQDGHDEYGRAAQVLRWFGWAFEAGEEK